MGAGTRESDRHPEGPYEASWIAAYAMGLASADRRFDTCLRELAEAAEGEPQRLREACDRLKELEGFDEELRVQAEALLTAVVEQADEIDLVDAGMPGGGVVERLDALDGQAGEGRRTA